jgi:hypothetical protein
MFRQAASWRRWTVAPAIALYAATPACGAGADGRHAMTLAVQTHFSQGWPLSWLPKARALGATAIRDGLPWGSVEAHPGVYTFPPALDAYMHAAAAAGMRVVVTIAPTNPLYDQGKTVQTPEGVAALASFLDAVATRYGQTLQGIEVGNEINTHGGLSGPAAADRAAGYARILAGVYPHFKSKHPDILILGGSTNVIGVGLLDAIFRAGGLANMDAAVVHPYRAHAEGIDLELDRLQAAMTRSGGVKPIYATEFGEEFDDPSESAPLLIKMVAMMGASHVAWSSWYVLHDEPYFRNMGLLDPSGQQKPAARAFSLAQHDLIPVGDPVRVDTGDSGAFVYRYGNGAYVMWGLPQAVSFQGQPRVRNAVGDVVAAPKTLSDDPVIVDGPIQLHFGDDQVVADSLYEYGRAPWSYFARAADGALHPLSLVDWEWTSYFGCRTCKPLRINADSLAPGGDQASPIAAVERFTAKSDETVEAVGQLSVSTKGPGVLFSLAHNGSGIFATPITGAYTLQPVRVSLRAGDTLDVIVAPRTTSSGASTQIHVRLLRVPAQ